MKRKFNGWYVVLGFFVVFILVLFLNKSHRKQALKKSLKTYAVVVTRPFSGARTPLSIKFEYKNKNGKATIISRQVNKNCAIIEGDTIYIRYSLTDNSVAEIIHCYWNDKLREDMNNQVKQ